MEKELKKRHDDLYNKVKEAYGNRPIQARYVYDHGAHYLDIPDAGVKARVDMVVDKEEGVSIADRSIGIYFSDIESGIGRNAYTPDERAFIFTPEQFSLDTTTDGDVIGCQVYSGFELKKADLNQGELELTLKLLSGKNPAFKDVKEDILWHYEDLRQDY